MNIFLGYIENTTNMVFRKNKSIIIQMYIPNCGGAILHLWTMFHYGFSNATYETV